MPKYFNRDPKRFIFQSTYLRNIDQMETLAAILDRIRPNLQLVRHLYISTYDLEMEQLGSDIRKKLQRKWGLDAQSRRKKYMEEVFRLIFRRTGRHFMCCYAIETRFLQLEELTVFGQSFDCNHLPLHLTFPNLQHVHLPEPPAYLWRSITNF